MTKTQEEFVRNLCDGYHTARDITEKYNAEFGKNKTVVYIRNVLCSKGLKLGKTMAKKAVKALYEGKTYGKMDITTMSGRVITTPDGKKQRVNHFLWEYYHGKKVPKGMVIHFLDGDTKNKTKENMVLITRQENMALAMTGYKQIQPELKPSLFHLIKMEVKAGIHRRSL